MPKADIGRCEYFEEDVYGTIVRRLGEGAGLMQGAGVMTLYDIFLRVAFSAFAEFYYFCKNYKLIIISTQ